VDSPSKGEVSPYLGFWFLNPGACQVCLHCIVHITSYSCLAFCLRNHLFYPHIFSCCLEKLLHVLSGDDRESTSLLFCLGNFKPLSLRSVLLLSYMLGLDVISFLHKHVFVVFLFIFFSTIKKKKLGEKMHNFYFIFFIAFQILHVFLPYISVHYALIKYAFI